MPLFLCFVAKYIKEILIFAELSVNKDYDSVGGGKNIWIYIYSEYMLDMHCIAMKRNTDLFKTQKHPINLETIKAKQQIIEGMSQLNLCAMTAQVAEIHARMNRLDEPRANIVNVGSACCMASILYLW